MNAHSELTPTRAASSRAARRRGARGMTTAEYAVGTIAAVSFAGILIKILTDPSVQDLILRLIQFLIKLFWPGGAA